MVDYTEPTSWTAPYWHQDYGDVQAELDHLRNLAQSVIEQMPQLSVGLSVPEDGVMFLVITSDNKKVLAEIYSIQFNGGNRQRKYGVFLYPNTSTEEEQYTPSTTEVIDLLKSVGTRCGPT